MNKHSKIQKQLRNALTIFLIGSVLIVYPYTEDPFTNVKWFILTIAATFISIFLIFLRAFQGTNNLSKITTSFFLISLLYGIMFLSAILSNYRFYAITQSRYFFILVLFVFITQNLLTHTKHLTTILSALNWGLAISCIYGFCQYLGWDPLPWEFIASRSEDRLAGTLGHPNYVGHAVVLGVVSAIYLLLAKKRIIGVFFLIIFLAHIFLARYRSGIVSIVIATFLGLVAITMCRFTFIPKKTRAILCMFITVLLLTLGIAGGMGYYYMKVGIPFPLEMSLMDRIHGYWGATELILERPLRGYGPGVYEIENPRKWTPYEQERFARGHIMNKHVHNEFLELAFDGGAFATGIYLVLLTHTIFTSVLFLFTTRDVRRRSLMLFFACFFMAFSVDGLFGFNLHAPVSGVFFAIILGAFSNLLEEKLYAPHNLSLSNWIRVPSIVALIPLAIFSCFIECREFGAKTLQYLGQQAAKSGNDEHALGALVKAYQWAPWNWEIPCEIGNVLVNKNRPELAGLYYRDAIRRNPNHIMSLLNYSSCLVSYAEILNKKNDPKNETNITRLLNQAEEVTTRVLKLCSKLSVAHELYGKIYLAHTYLTSSPTQNTFLENAYIQFQKAFELDPTPSYLYWIVLVESEKKNLEIALAHLANLAQWKPEWDPVWDKWFEFSKDIGSYTEFKEGLYYALQHIKNQESKKRLIEKWSTHLPK